MKISSAFIGLAAAASLVSAGKFFPIDNAKSAGFVENAFIIEYEEGINHLKVNNFFNSHKIAFKLRGEFNLFNGASITVSSGHSGEDLAKIRGVKRVWPVEIFSVGKPKPIEADPVKALLTTSHSMTGVDYVQTNLKYTGKGVKVGVIDSGVDYTHPALDGDTPKQDSDPMDKCNGHGTHVAGIIGADARKVDAPHPFTGVAPEVIFGAYRALNCNGRGSNESIMQ
ncbi:hypothetical protein BGZ94_003008, partial [Podila epigama]